MSSRRRRRSRVGTHVHGGTGNETTHTNTAGDDEATDLIPDHPATGSEAAGDTVNRAPV